MDLWKNNFCDVIEWIHNFLDTSSTETFPLVVRHNLAKFHTDRSVADLQSLNVLTILLYFETCLCFIILLIL